MDKKVVKEHSIAIVDRLLEGEDANLSISLPLGDIFLHRLVGRVVVLAYREGVTVPTGLDHIPIHKVDDLKQRVYNLIAEFWSDAASPNVKVTDIESLSRSLHSLMSLFVEPAIRQLYFEKVAKAGLDISDEDTLYVHRNDFGGLYLRKGALCVSMAEDEDIVQKVCDLLSDSFTRIVKSLNDN